MTRRDFVARAAARAVLLGAGLFAATAAAAAGTNTVRIDVEDAYLPEIDAAVWIVQLPKIEVPYALDAPASPGFTVGTVSSLSPGLGSVNFPLGATASSSWQVFGSEPFEAIGDGWEGRNGYVALTTTPPGVNVGPPPTLWILQVQESALLPRGSDGCFLCSLFRIVCSGAGGSCNICADSLPPFPARIPAGTRANGSGAFPDTSGLGVLRRYRDEIMATTPSGQYYTALYASLSQDAVRAMVASPSLAVRTYRGLIEWTPALLALVDGTGDSFTVSGSMEADLLALLDTFEAVGSPAFAQTLATERTRLHLDEIAGLSMTAFQEQIETLGGTSAIEPHSWGKVKALYR